MTIRNEPPGVIRPTRTDDLALLREIERAAGTPFAGIGMALVADDELPSIEDLDEYHLAGRAWVHTDAHDRPVAYVICDWIDGCAHVEQVSVHPDHAGRRLGEALLAHVAEWAASEGADAVTLTTFTDVPWNGPYYERIGFRYLDDDEVTPELRAIREDEIVRGLDRWPRACMRRELRPGRAR